MINISLNLDGVTYQGECALGQTLMSFLGARGLDEIPSMVQASDGRHFSSEFSLVHLLSDREFSSFEIEAGRFVPATSAEELLSLARPRA